MAGADGEQREQPGWKKLDGRSNAWRKRIPLSKQKEIGADLDTNTYEKNIDYIACTTRKPIEYADKLRCMLEGRKIAVFINVTMYNEDAEELKRTLIGLADNIEHLHNAGVPTSQILTSIVVDGRSKCHKSVLKYLEEELFLYDGSIIQDGVDGSDSTMHLFERTVRLAKHTAQRQYYRPMNLIFALKEKNGGKLNSHLWFFVGFCRLVVPKYIVLVDVGTQPKNNAIAKLHAAMEANAQIGGVCGEIAVRSPRWHNMIESAQHFEYKVSHVLDKAMESVFGYISVLPGAFSAYRWEALEGTPLSKYFYVEENSVKDMGPFMANMYLAEDRVLCFELVAKQDCDWVLHYEAGAVAETDVPDNILELIKQRRRWLNGAFFSLLYYILHFSQINKQSAHSWTRKFWFFLQFWYQVSTLLLNWFTVGSLYLSFSIVFYMLFESFFSVNAANFWKYAFNLIYFFLTVLQFLLGLGAKANDTHRIYHFCAMMYGFIMMAALVASFWFVFQNVLNFFVLIAAGIAFGSYFIGGLLHGELFTILAVVIHYMFMLPTFVNMFTIYSFCNMHDISWGTKEGNTAAESKRANNTRAKLAAHLKALASESKETPLQRAMEHMGAGGAASALAAKNSLGAPFGMLDIAALAASAEADQKREEDLARVQAELAAEHRELESQFTSFRTRLVTLWVFSNWTYVTFIAAFDYLSYYAMGVAIAILWTLGYRVIGSLLYVLNRGLRYVWRKMFYCISTRLCCCICRNRDIKRTVRAAPEQYHVEDVHDQPLYENIPSSMSARGRPSTQALIRPNNEPQRFHSDDSDDEYARSPAPPSRSRRVDMTDDLEKAQGLSRSIAARNEMNPHVPSRSASSTASDEDESSQESDGSDLSGSESDLSPTSPSSPDRSSMPSPPSMGHVPGRSVRQVAQSVPRVQSAQRVQSARKHSLSDL